MTCEFCKYHGLIYKEDWTSSALNKRDNIYTVGMFELILNKLPITKLKFMTVDPNASPMQMIPETFKVTAGWYDKSYYFKDGGLRSW